MSNKAKGFATLVKHVADLPSYSELVKLNRSYSPSLSGEEAAIRYLEDQADKINVEIDRLHKIIDQRGSGA